MEEEKLHDLVLRKDFINRISKAITVITQVKIDKLDYIITKNFCSSNSMTNI